MPDVLTPIVIPTNSESRVINGQPEGIGRLSVLDDFVAINNLGRNIEFSRWGNGKLEPFALFQDTVFPNEDEPSQFDLDLHAIIWTPGKEHLFAVNHYGLIRLFKLSQDQNLQPEHQFFWPGDVERFVFAGDKLVSTSPQGYSVKDPAQAGLLISDSWSTCVGKGGKLDYEVSFQNWGITTALAASPTMLAFAAGPRLGIAKIADFARLELEMELPFVVKWIHFAESCEQMILAGFSLAGNDAGENDWDVLEGGGYAVVDTRRQSIVASGEFDVDLAWGNGGIPLALSADCRTIFGVDKFGNMHAWDLGMENKRGRVVCGGENGDKELGIAHLDRLGDKLYCGFNRDGYRIRIYPAEVTRA